MKNGKAGGVDGVTTEPLKADLETTVVVLYELLLKIWELSERVPSDVSCGLIIRLPKKGNLMECGNWRVRLVLSLPFFTMSPSAYLSYVFLLGSMLRLSSCSHLYFSSARAQSVSGVYALSVE